MNENLNLRSSRKRLLSNSGAQQQPQPDEPAESKLKSLINQEINKKASNQPKKRKLSNDNSAPEPPPNQPNEIPIQEEVSLSKDGDSSNTQDTEPNTSSLKRSTRLRKHSNKYSNTSFETASSYVNTRRSSTLNSANSTNDTNSDTNSKSNHSTPAKVINAELESSKSSPLTPKTSAQSTPCHVKLSLRYNARLNEAKEASQAVTSGETQLEMGSCSSSSEVHSLYGESLNEDDEEHERKIKELKKIKKTLLKEKKQLELLEHEKELQQRVSSPIKIKISRNIEQKLLSSEVNENEAEKEESEPAKVDINDAKNGAPTPNEQVAVIKMIIFIIKIE